MSSSGNSSQDLLGCLDGCDDESGTIDMVATLPNFWLKRATVD
jgi:hypothetical protein